MKYCAILVVLLVAATWQMASCTPSISSITTSADTVELFNCIKICFQVSTVATNLYWPYDADPPSGVPAGIGVSVDGLFSNDNWKTTIIQPAFYFQDYERANYLFASQDKDWLYPKGEPCWMIRFSPIQTGLWHYKIRVVDSGGTAIYESSDAAFTCVGGSSAGFVCVSSTDPRYFETSNGNYLNLVGIHEGVSCTYDIDSRYALLASNGINLIRCWWQGSGGPVLSGIGGQGGIPGWSKYTVTSDVARSGELFSGKLPTNASLSTNVDVKPSTNYRFTALVKTVGLSGTGDYGVFLQAFDCTQADLPLTDKLKGDNDWTQLQATITTKSGQHSIGWLKITMTGCDSGSAYWTDISLREVLSNGKLGPELISKPNPNIYSYISQREAWIADYAADCATRNHMYLKVCLQEKEDPVLCRISSNGTAGTYNVTNFYANSSHACRKYQEYFWRYVVARYSYATSIHSWEFCNEGDPFNGNHYDGAEAMASYFNANDPNHHLVTTSFWHSFPTREFWTNTNYPDIGYADWHQYIGLQSGSDGLQYTYGWPRLTKNDNSVYRSSPSSLHLVGDGDECLYWSTPFAIIPNHSYTLSCYIKGSNLTITGSNAEVSSWIYPTIRVGYQDGRVSNEISKDYPNVGGQNTYLGTYNWKLWTYTFTPPTGTKYLTITPSPHWAVGDIWFDDITLKDNTTGKNIEVPNGNFDSARLDYDTALMTYSLNTQVGSGNSRAVIKPVIRGECGISGDNIYGSPYEGVYFTGENQQLINDDDGIWYKKYVWGQINPGGVIDMYWWIDNLYSKSLYRYARAYQSFISGIHLSNGKYEDAGATCSNTQMRAWGQKDLVNNNCHLWIDNVPYNWKNVVDGVAVSAVSGTVTVSGLKDSTYQVEWWDTSSGEITSKEEVVCSGGTLTLNIANLQSDVACKIYLLPAKVDLRILVPSSQVAPGQIVTVTVEYTNSGETDGHNVIVTARVPNEMEYVEGSAEETGGTWDAADRSVTWTIESVAAHETGTRTFRAIVE